MGICDSNKNQAQTPIANNTQPSAITSQVQTSLSQQPVQNVTSTVEQNINTDTNVLNNNDNLINGNEQNYLDRPGTMNSGMSIGEEVRNEDSIGYNQTRDTLAN